MLSSPPCPACPPLVVRVDALSTCHPPLLFFDLALSPFPLARYAAALSVTGVCCYLTHIYVMDISGKNDKNVGISWNPRMALAGAKMERFTPSELEDRKDK